MKKLLFVFAFLAVSVMSLTAKTVNFNDGWKFKLGDFPEAKGAQFDDSDWRKLSLPHDWAFEGGYSQHGVQRDMGGYAMGGIGWYRKSIELTADQLADKNYFIDFEAIYRKSDVWVNGHFIGHRPYGYISFSYDMTPYLVEGENVISVRVDNSLEPSARWYHGCGIYGNVFMRVKNSVYFEYEGVTITTPNITEDKGEVVISAEVTTTAPADNAVVKFVIVDGNDSEVSSTTLNNVNLSARKNIVTTKAVVNSPKLWSPDSPSLYTVKISIATENGLVDSEVERFGFRTVEWCADNGFILNGKQLKLQGVCEHMEGGPTGAFTSEAIFRWRMQNIKDMGCNAVRFAHNPYLPGFYSICDEIGLLVMDEIFDGWSKKADHDYGGEDFADWWERDVRAWIRRDKNHPSIFLYSVGNETHGDIARKLVATCHEEDPTRLVTSGDCNPDDMDVYGVNGRSETFSFIKEWDKRKPFVATENPHTWQVRGYYRTQTWYRDGYPNPSREPQFMANLTDKEIFGYDWTTPEKRRTAKQIFNSSYDNAYVRVSARHLIEILRDSSWFSGSFRWTGYDYLGEAGYVHGGWPFRAFQSGALDLAGFPKDLFFLYQSNWSKKDMVHILPHWTHPAMAKGELVPVWAYTNGDEAELFLNGKSYGRKKKGSKWDELQIEWLVPYKEGEVKVVAYRNGKKIATAVQKTADAPAKLALSFYEDRQLKADGSDVSIITIEQQDKKGVMYPYGENRVHAKIYGPAKMLSFESGSPVDVETNYNADSKKCFMGLNRMFVQSTCKCDKPVSMVVAAINGDKKLMLSNKISISVDQISLRGDFMKRDLTVRYTTDGSEPTQKSAIYKRPFAIKLGTVVKATVFEGDEAIIKMEEPFTEEDGLVWGTPGGEICAFTGEQAEFAKIVKANKTKWGGDGFFAEGFVLLHGKGSAITWYQENDGSPFTGEVTFRYSQQLEKGDISKMELWNNENLIKVIEFKNTGSVASHWTDLTVKVPFISGGNNIKLVAISDGAPAFDQMEVKQK